MPSFPFLNQFSQSPVRRRTRLSLVPILPASLALHALLALAISRFIPDLPARDKIFEVELRQPAAKRPIPKPDSPRHSSPNPRSKPALLRQPKVPKVLSNAP